MLLALIMHVLKRLENARWLLWLLVACFPLPLIAINMGWAATEVGRQPWIVQGLLRTTDGVSPVVSAGEIWTTLGLFGLIYLVLFIAWLRIFLGIVRKGPEDVVEMLRGRTGLRAARSRRRGEVTRMTLENIWFFLVAFLLTGYVILDGFDLGAGVLYPFVATHRGREARGPRLDRPDLGRQRGLAGHRRRRASSRPFRWSTP